MYEHLHATSLWQISTGFLLILSTIQTWVNKVYSNIVFKNFTVNKYADRQRRKIFAELNVVRVFPQSQQNSRVDYSLTPTLTHNRTDVHLWAQFICWFNCLRTNDIDVSFACAMRLHRKAENVTKLLMPPQPIEVIIHDKTTRNEERCIYPPARLLVWSA